MTTSLENRRPQTQMNDQFLLAMTLTALPVVVRITAMVLTMPLVASRVVPPRVKAALVIALSVMVVPNVFAAGNLPPTNLVSLALAMVNEVLIGALMGLSLSVILAGVQLAGTLIEGLCGFSLTAFGGTPDSENGSGPFAKLFWWTTAAVFIAAGGVGQVVDGLLFSFAVLPVGNAVFDQSFVDFLVNSIGRSFEFGLSAALPAIAALLVASMVLGMAQRNFPQLGGMQVGLNIKAIFGMVVTSLVLLSAPWIINGGFELTMDELRSLLEQVKTG